MSPYSGAYSHFVKDSGRFMKAYKCKAVVDGPVGQVLATPLFLKVKTKFHFTESK